MEAGKKKVFVLLLVIASVFVLAACTGGAKTGNNTPSTSTGEVNPSSNSNEENNNLLGATFENDTLTNANITLKITGHEFDADDEGKPILRIFFEYTNNSSEAYKVAYIPQEYFDPIQNTGAFTEHLQINLGPSNPKYKELNDVFSKEVNPGYTVKSLAEYELVDTSTPIEFIIRGSDWGDEITRKTFEVK